MRATTIDMFFRLGITQHLIRSGIVRLEEIRDGTGALVNLHIRVSETMYAMERWRSLTN